MRDNRKVPFVSDLSDEVRGENGRKKLKVKSYVRFNDPEESAASSSGFSKFRDLAEPMARYEVVQGKTSPNPHFIPQHQDPDNFGTEVYGQTVYTNVEVLPGVKQKVRTLQAGYSFPISGDIRDKMFIARQDSFNLNPSDAVTNPNGLTFMFKGVLDQAQNTEALFLVADPHTSRSTFAIEFTGAATLNIVHKDNSGGSASKTVNINPQPPGGFVTLFVQAGVTQDGRPYVEKAAVYDTDLGGLISIDNPRVVAPLGSTPISLQTPTVAIGYGSNSGGWNSAYTNADFLRGGKLTEFAVFDGLLLESDMEFIATSHLAKNHYRSGYNNRSPRRTQQILDARSKYPVSSNPLRPPTNTLPFNDMDTKVFGQRPPKPQTQVYPDMLLRLDPATVSQRTSHWTFTNLTGTSVATTETIKLRDESLTRTAVLKSDGSSWRVQTNPQLLEDLPPGTYYLNFKLGSGLNSGGSPFETGDFLVVTYGSDLGSVNAHIILLKRIRNVLGEELNTDRPTLGNVQYRIPITKTQEDTNFYVAIFRDGSGMAAQDPYVILWDVHLTSPKNVEDDVVFPEMLPASLFSGSQTDYYNSNGTLVGVGGVGNTHPFYRDIHNTPFAKRLSGPAVIRHGLTHEPTELLDKSTRNSPVSISQDTTILGGKITPFDDSNPLADQTTRQAVSSDVYFGLQQRLSDHVAIVIDLNPTVDSTIGVERDPDSGKATGRVTSMAYFNFSTKKWETSGKNNDFIVPGAITISTASSAFPNKDTRLAPAREAAVYQKVAEDLFKQTAVGFVGTSGFTIENTVSETEGSTPGSSALAALPTRGQPTSNYGFPYSEQYEAKDDQLIDMSEYIDAPFLLERVSFEFGAAIEDSGPHSLGYIKDYVDLEDEGVGKLNRISKHTNSLKTTNPVGWQRADQVDQGSSQIQLTRGEFINGTNIDDGRVSTSPVHQIAQFQSSSAVPLRRLMLGRDSGYTPASFGLTADQLYMGPSILGDSTGMGTSISFSKTDRAGNAVGCKMLLQTRLGPRGDHQDADNQRQLHPDINGNGAASYIPIIAGGINGVVTGNMAEYISRLGSYSTYTTGPYAFIQHNAESDDDNTATKMDTGLRGEGGGTPFWRADSFFLLRQSKKSTRSKIYSSAKITGGLSHPLMPLAPWVGFEQTWFSQYRPLGDVEDGLFGNRTRMQVGSAFSSGSFPDSGAKTLVAEYSSDTSREIITFGQMTHYGYTNAADSFVDRITTDPVIPRASGSWNRPSLRQLFAGDPVASPTTATPRSVPLFGQAIKYANYIDFGFSSIPTNPETVSSDTSLFSDAPDTYQGQWSFDPYKVDGDAPYVLTASQWRSYNEDNTNIPVETGDAVGDPYNGDPWNNPTTTAHRFTYGYYRNNSFTTSESLRRANYYGLLSRNRAGTARYALSGCAPSVQDPIVTAAELGDSVDTEYGYTLDTWRYGYAGQFGSNLHNDRQPTKYRPPCYIRLAGGVETGGAQGEGNYEEAPYQYRRHGTMPQGSGFSVISTPAYLAGEVDTTLRPRPEHFAEYGDFTSGSSRFRTPNWLDAGLGRDLNIRLNRGFKHAGRNPDFNDSWSGFTLMTASTVWRPFEAPGRESAALPLVANVYKRQYLNYQNDFRIDVPVRAINPSFAESPGYWVFTSEPIMLDKGSHGITQDHKLVEPCHAAWGSQAGNVAGRAGPSNGRAIDDSYLTTAFNDLDFGPVLDRYTNAAKNLPINIRATTAKRFHTRYSVTISEGGFVPGPSLTGVNSGRMFSARASGMKPQDIKLQGSRTVGVNTFYKNNVTEVTPADQPSSTVAIDNVVATAQASSLSGSIPDTAKRDALYILNPSDKLVLGVQPALPGWNAGSGLPNNRASMKWGVWDYESSATARSVRTRDVDTAGNVKEPSASMMNLEDPYEPSHGLTMLRGPSRVILYGTFLRNNKHFSPSSTQTLDSDSVHEALHYDNPVLDQFLVDSADEYASSYLTQHVTGSILDGGRGVAGTIEEGNLYVSASFQRFTRATEDSAKFFDSLQQDPFDIAAALGGRTRRTGPEITGDYSIISLNSFSQAFAEGNAFLLDQTGGSEKFAYAFAHGWSDSFPFEEKFKDVTRLVSYDTRFGAKQSAIQRVQFPSSSFGNGVTNSPSTHAPNGEEAVLKFIQWNAKDYDGNGLFSPADISSYVQGNFPTPSNVYAPGIDIATIYNMADVRTANFEEGTAPGGSPNVALQTTFALKDALPYASSDRRASRMFFAAQIGYGKRNRKQLDVHTWRTLVQQSATWRGLGYFDHPAGFKYGYMNCDQVSPSIVHRGDRFGNFRDMLEQRLYSKVYNFGDEFNKRGVTESAVTCIFVDAEGAPLSDATKTQCLNLSTAMTSSKPFIEGEVVREIIFNSESVTVE